MIDRYLLRYFLAVIDQGNFTRAAQACNISQPTLSVGIARLEKLIGAPLFNRSNRRVDLTAVGANLAAHARQIEAQFNAAERVGLQGKTRRLVRLGVLNTLPERVLAKVATSVATWDEGQVELIEGRERDLTERLATARIDAALTIIPPEGTRWHSLAYFTEGYSLALPESHPLAREAQVHAADLADNVMIVRRQCELLSRTSQHFTRHGVRPFFAARTMNDERALAYVAAGLGITVMPDGFTAPGVVRVPLAEFNHTRTIGCLFRGDSDPAASLAERLAEAIGGQ